jgi:hypothetical protein
MAGDGGRVPDVSEQRAEAERPFARVMPEMESRFMWAASTGNHPDATAEGAVRTIIEPLLADPASVLAALLAESSEATVAAIEALLTSDEAVEVGANTIVKQDLLMRTDDSLMGVLEVTADPAREFYEDAVRSACRSLLSKAPKEDGDA